MPKTPPQEVSLMTRFWLRTGFVDPRSGDCMEWMGRRLPTGYGQLTGPSGEVLYSHRVSWALIHGPIPDGKVIRHLCNNPSCVRPSHLAIGTHKDNAADKVAAGRTQVIEPPCDDEVAAIRYLIASGRWSQGDAARLILGDGAAQPMVNRIVTGKSRKSAPGPITKKGRGVPPKRRPHLENC
jgi:hypothetical protein